MIFENTFKALSDEKRREILKLLKNNKKMHVNELAEHFDMSLATLSYHLSLLKKADLIIEEKDKNYRYYSLNLSVFEELLTYFYDFFKEE